MPCLVHLVHVGWAVSVANRIDSNYESRESARMG